MYAKGLSRHARKRARARLAFLLDFTVFHAGRVIVRGYCLHSWNRTHP